MSFWPALWMFDDDFLLFPNSSIEKRTKGLYFIKEKYNWWGHRKEKSNQTKLHFLIFRTTFMKKKNIGISKFIFYVLWLFWKFFVNYYICWYVQNNGSKFLLRKENQRTLPFNVELRNLPYPKTVFRGSSSEILLIIEWQCFSRKKECLCFQLRVFLDITYKNI